MVGYLKWNLLLWSEKELPVHDKVKLFNKRAAFGSHVLLHVIHHPCSAIKPNKFMSFPNSNLVEWLFWSVVHDICEGNKYFLISSQKKKSHK